MNPPNNSTQNPPSTSAVQQVNPAINPQMFNGNGNGNVGGGLFPNNMSVAAAQPCFMNFPSQPFPTAQFPNGVGGFTPPFGFNQFPINNQFNPSQQQHGQGQFFPMNPTAYQQVGQQALLQNTIQNIYQLLHLQNQCPPANNIPMFHNPQNPGFSNMGQQLQANPFLPGTSFQNQIPQSVGPQNQMFGMANMNATMQNANQGPPGFATPMINSGEKNNPSPPLTNFRGNKTYNASHKGSQFQKDAKQKFGNVNGNMSKAAEGGNNMAVQNSTKFEKKLPVLNYTEQEIKDWCEARKKNHPSNGSVSKKKKEPTSTDADQEAMLRRQQLKEILAKQVELGCEVADIPASILHGPDGQNPRGKKHERHQFKKGKFQNKRRTTFQDRKDKKARTRDQKADHQTKREPSLLQKLLTQDIKRDKNHLLQVFRFMTANSFFAGESLRFPPVVVRETNVVEETTCSVVKAEETSCDLLVSKVKEEEEGEIID